MKWVCCALFKHQAVKPRIQGFPGCRYRCIICCFRRSSSQRYDVRATTATVLFLLSHVNGTVAPFPASFPHLGLSLLAGKRSTFWPFFHVHARFEWCCFLSPPRRHSSVQVFFVRSWCVGHSGQDDDRVSLNGYCIRQECDESDSLLHGGLRS